MDNLRNSLVLLQPTPADAKLSGWYVLGGNVVIETIAQYLARVPVKHRSPDAPVTMQLPKPGYTSLGTYTIAEFKGGILANFEGHYYTFIGGLADVNFVEIKIIHNKTKFKQGGSEILDEFYHLTLAQVNDLHKPVTVNPGSAAFGSIDPATQEITLTEPTYAALPDKPSTFAPSAHTHPISDVTNLSAELANKLETSLKGTANGLAELDASGFVKNTQLPSYVDDVLEYANLAALPATGETGKIYITIDDNKTYRWSGTVYAVISDTLALGETYATAYRGDRGKTAYDYSQIGHVTLTDGRIVNWDSAYSNRITSLTTTGNSGAATLVSNVLNIPNYTLSGLGGEPAFAKNTGFNKNFGTTTGTVLEGRTFGTAAASATTDFAPSSVYPATGLTTGYVPYKTSTVLANSGLYYDGTNFGIGTTDPRAKLHIVNTTPTTYNPIGYNAANNITLAGANADQAYTFINFASHGQMQQNFGVVQQGAGGYLGQGDFVWQGYNRIAYTEWMRLTFSGNVGIGDAAPGTKLSVVGNAQIGYATGQTGPANGLIINGNVGIGTTVPHTKLEVAGATQATGGAYYTFGNLLVSSTDTEAINMGGSISLGGVTSGTTIYTYGQIRGAKETSGVGSALGYLAFETNNNNNLVERMRITSSGNIIVNGLASTYSRLLSTSSTGQLTPIADGTAGQALITNGEGVYSFGTPWTGLGYLTAITKAQVEAVLIGAITSHTHAASWAGLPDYQEFEFQNVIEGAQSWDLHIKPTFGYTIESISLETDSGTITGVSVLINATTITGLSGITVDTGVDTTSSTALKTVFAGDRITLSKTGESGVPTLIKGQINYIRT